MVLIRPEFISPSEADELIATFRYVSDNSEPDGGHVRKWPYRNALSAVLLLRAGKPGIAELLGGIRREAADSLIKFYGIQERAHIDYTLMSEMKIGDCIPPHADNEVHMNEGVWLPNHTHYHHCGATLYLNTCGADYQGGLLRFPSTGKEIMPRTGLLVGFPSGRKHEHEVTPIQSGSRFTLSVWLTLYPEHAERWPS
jgi:hypothetical protein